jgi:hypothetical protein
VLIAAAGRFRPDFEAWIERDMAARVRLVMTALTILTSGPLIGFAGYLWHLGRRPYPRAHLMRWLGVALGLAALLLTFFLWRVVSLFPIR